MRLARSTSYHRAQEPDPEAVARGAAIYARECLACHGRQSEDGYVFEGKYLGEIEPNDAVGTDPARLDSYTQEFRDLQVSKLFAGTPYAFKEFTKTNGYANMPLDGLWLRAPYLHNGIAETLEEIWTRYNPEDKHGVTNDMTKDQLNELIEYLKTL